MAKLIINFKEIYSDYRKKAVISIESFNFIADLKQYLKETYHIKYDFYLESKLGKLWLPSTEKINILKSGDEVRLRLIHPKSEDSEEKRKKKRKLSLEPEPEVNELQEDGISLKKKKKKSTEDFDACVENEQEETVVAPMEIPAQTSPNNFSKAFRDATASIVGYPGTSSPKTDREQVEEGEEEKEKEGDEGEGEEKKEEKEIEKGDDGEEQEGGFNGYNGLWYGF